jgi:hypothetical protein
MRLLPERRPVTACHTSDHGLTRPDVGHRDQGAVIGALASDSSIGTLFGQSEIDRKPARFRREFAEMWGSVPKGPVTPVIGGRIGRRSVIKTRDQSWLSRETLPKHYGVSHCHSLTADTPQPSYHLLRFSVVWSVIRLRVGGADNHPRLCGRAGGSPACVVARC